MKLVYMGTPDFAVGALEALHKAGHEICLVVSQPDKPVGRHAELKPTPVKQKALDLGLTVMQPQKANDPAFLDVIRGLSPDAIIVAAYGKILRPALLEIPKYGCINIHGSLLPKYRGAAPIQWAVYNGDRESGLTIMQMSEGMDTGDILMQKSIPLHAEETGGTLFDKLAGLSGPLIVEALDLLEKGRLTPQKQKEEAATTAPPLTKEMSVLDFHEPAKQLEQKIRAFDPWPGTVTKLGDKNLKILKATAVSDDTESCKITKNDIFGNNEGKNCIAESIKEKCNAADKVQGPSAGDPVIIGDELYFKCGVGYLKVLELQLEGKKRVSTADFLRGNRDLFK